MADYYKVPETHPHFKLNKQHFSNAELRQHAFHFIKEGEAYEEEVGNFILEWLKPQDFVEVKTSGSRVLDAALK